MTYSVPLVVHIGTGKAGSTAIQQYCKANSAELLQQGVAYLGTALEGCQTQAPFDWQHQGGSYRLLHELDPEVAQDQIYKVLREELTRLSGTGISRVLWSNETLFARKASIVPALQRLKDEGLDLTVVVYLRSHGQWARSAYAQWGIQHKSYNGPVKPFADWIEERPVRFAGNLRFWENRLGDVLRPRNYHEVRDTVRDLFEIAGIEAQGTLRALESPDTAELLARAVFNNQFEHDVLPAEFTSAMRVMLPKWRDRSAVPQPDVLFPDSDAIEVLQESCREDLSAVNEILRAHGQTELEFGTLRDTPDAPDAWTMIQFLLVTVFSLQVQVDQLSKRLERDGD